MSHFKKIAFFDARISKDFQNYNFRLQKAESLIIFEKSSLRKRYAKKSSRLFLPISDCFEEKYWKKQHVKFSVLCCLITLADKINRQFIFN